MKLTVTSGEEGRVDKLLAKHYPEAGRKQLAELFETGEVKLRGKRAKKGDFVVAGDEVELAREPVSGDALRPQPDPSVELEILLERPELVVVAQARRDPVAAAARRRARHDRERPRRTLPECAAIGNDPRDGGLVHRLDIGTSGVLVAARTAEAYRGLREAFGKGSVHKEYLAITDGAPGLARDATRRSRSAATASRRSHRRARRPHRVHAPRVDRHARARALHRRDRPHAPGPRAPRVMRTRRSPATPCTRAQRSTGIRASSSTPTCSVCPSPARPTSSSPRSPRASATPATAVGLARLP